MPRVTIPRSHANQLPMVCMATGAKAVTTVSHKFRDFPFIVTGSSPLASVLFLVSWLSSKTMTVKLPLSKSAADKLKLMQTAGTIGPIAIVVVLALGILGLCGGIAATLSSGGGMESVGPMIATTVVSVLVFVVVTMVLCGGFVIYMKLTSASLPNMASMTNDSITLDNVHPNFIAAFSGAGPAPAGSSPPQQAPATAPSASAKPPVARAPQAKPPPRR